jgi:hydroxybutyrate-dimer hydrolase
MTAVPSFIVGQVISTDYPGNATVEARPSTAGVIRRVAEPWDDLQTAGLSKDQLAKPFDLEHLIQDPLAPTVAELRRLAIHSNYTALMETTTDGGFGLLFGPDRNGPVRGREYLALARAAPGDDVVTLMVQIPTNFDLRHPMIVTAPSSGSRGVYGAISTAEWAFLNGCAIAYTDKGTAPGFHDLDSGSVYDLEGRRIDAQNTRNEPVFRVAPSPDLAAFNTEFPHRLAAKHAHSRKNIELNWGRYVLLSIDFAFYCLNEYLGPKHGSFDRTNTKVMATGVSNGGGAAILAAEQDDAIKPLIDAVVVSEPQVQPTPGDFVIRFRNEEFKNHSRSLLDTATLMNLYAPCAAFVLDNSDPSSANQQRRAQRCGQLRAAGLLKSDDVVEQAREAIGIIHRHGLLEEADLLLPLHELLGFWELLAAFYANAYARASVSDHLCGVSLAPIDGNGRATAMPPPLQAQLFGWSNGLSYVSPMGSANVIDDQGTSPSDLGAALCFRSLTTGTFYPKQNSVEARWSNFNLVQAGVAEVRAKGNLRGKPSIILHGRCDALIPPNHSSRPYYGLNQSVEKGRSRLSYIEVVNGNHFDHFIPQFGPKSLVPMHYYFERALTLMRKHLLDPGNSPLPPSQVVPATANHKPWTQETYKQDLPDIQIEPQDKNRIAYCERILSIPIGQR